MYYPFKYLLVAVFTFGMTAVLAGPSFATPLQDRSIAFYNIHTKETVRVIYKRNGVYQPKAMKRINWVLRDWRRNEPTRIDPKLIDLVWEIHSELGSREPIHVISGFRSQKTNAMLRRRRGGQARRSQHILGKAIDIRFPDVPVHRLRYAGLIRERGGVGYYPTSGTPFVHIDTGRVRHWPRMGRHELSLLFPNGKSRHYPSGGRPITKQDAKRARQRYPDLARRVAAYHDLRRSKRQDTLIAAAAPSTIVPFSTNNKTQLSQSPKLITPPQLIHSSITLNAAPKLLAPPRLVDRPSRLKPGLNQADRAALTRLAAFAALQDTRVVRQAKYGAPLSFIAAPDYDDDHPEEMSYRPFPVFPFLTTTASPPNRLLASFVHPDMPRTLDILNNEGSVPAMRLRPGLQTSQLFWSESFAGNILEHDLLKALYSERDTSTKVAPGMSFSSRPVTTSR